MLSAEWPKASIGKRRKREERKKERKEKKKNEKRKKKRKKKKKKRKKENQKERGGKSFPMVSGTRCLILPFSGDGQSSEGDSGPSALRFPGDSWVPRMPWWRPRCCTEAADPLLLASIGKADLPGGDRAT